ncbi:MAG TPA: glycoside hydrolase family 3 C-terminal domain-containing protein [Gemmatimonadaceae bacterium]|nr:glycoside hydrolase family 3 C-terminal domain-containing protein [Gemmatimonadaceae bacterium]
MIRGLAAATVAGLAITVAATSWIVSPDIRAWEVERKMTDDERFGMLYSLMPINPRTGKPDPRVPSDAPRGAGYVRGVPRLGIPAVNMIDAGLGVTNPAGYRPGDAPTAFPAGVALAATFNPPLARRMGEIIGREARARGFNVALGGGISLIRDPRGGRNFEHISEDPWLSGAMGGEMVAGTQSQGVIASLKHVSLSASETNKFALDAQIDGAAHRESDLLAFQLAIERGQPGTLMCAHNKVNGTYACGNDPILNGVIKTAWGYKGWIHSDRQAVHNWSFALTGLDQESAAQLDSVEWFNEPLRDAADNGIVSHALISDMVRRMLRSYFAVGIDRWTRPPHIDSVADGAAALEIARQAIVLLKNEKGALPIGPKARRIAIIGGHADIGVLSGGGSSQGSPPTGQAITIPVGGQGPVAAVRREVYFGSSPLKELKKLLPTSEIVYDPGGYPSAAADVAKQADIAIVFATRHESEGFDAPDLSLPYGQDALIQAVAAANPSTIVVLETGSPVDMPWRDHVKGIVEAWFPGQFGGQAIAEVLTGVISPSGRLPMTFPRSVEQTPHPRVAGGNVPLGAPTSFWYHEGAEVGYRWFAKMQEQPLFAFGFGLTYTGFSYDDFSAAAQGDTTIAANVTVMNTGRSIGADVPQLYLVHAPDGRRERLLGFERVTLRPGESRRVSLVADPRLLARFDTTERRWRLEDGQYTVALARAADSVVDTRVVQLRHRLFGR